MEQRFQQFGPLWAFVLTLLSTSTLQADPIDAEVIDTEVIDAGGIDAETIENDADSISQPTPGCEEGATKEEPCDGSSELQISSCQEGAWVVDTPCDPESCVPSCDEKACGDDGCGGACGSCNEGEICTPDSNCMKLEGPCANACGQQSGDGCWCDLECFTYDDCCDDACESCGFGCSQATASCVERCGDTSTGLCKCDEQCSAFGDCCDDVCVICGYCDETNNTRQLLGNCPTDFPPTGCCASTTENGVKEYVLHVCADDLEWLETCPGNTICGVDPYEPSQVACLPEMEATAGPACVPEDSTVGSERSTSPGDVGEITATPPSPDPQEPDTWSWIEPRVVEVDSGERAFIPLESSGRKDGCMQHGTGVNFGWTIFLILGLFLHTRRSRRVC